MPGVSMRKPSKPSGKKRKGMLAYDALKQIGAIYKLDNELAGLEPV